MPPEDLKELLKHEPVHKFVERTNVVVAGDIFYFALFSGGEPSVFAIQADHAKQVMRLLMDRIEKYEKEHGPLQGRLPSEPMVSPLQFDKPDSPPEKPIPPTKGRPPEL